LSKDLLPNLLFWLCVNKAKLSVVLTHIAANRPKSFDWRL
jgi:hypothetical protein